MDLHTGPVHYHVLDDQAHEPLAGVEVECLDRGADALSEAGEPTAQAVLAGELGAALGERLVFLGQLLAA